MANAPRVREDKTLRRTLLRKSAEGSQRLNPAEVSCALKPSCSTTEQEDPLELFQLEPEVQALLEVWASPPFDLLATPAVLARACIAAYPDTDLIAESRKIVAWWIANPSRRKTKRGLPRFLNAWFSRAARPPLPAERRGGPQRPTAARYSAAEVWGDDDGR